MDVTLPTLVDVLVIAHPGGRCLVEAPEKSFFSHLPGNDILFHLNSYQSFYDDKSVSSGSVLF